MELREWNAKPPADKTWDNFKTFIQDAEYELRLHQNTTSARQGYGNAIYQHHMQFPFQIPNAPYGYQQYPTLQQPQPFANLGYTLPGLQPRTSPGSSPSSCSERNYHDARPRQQDRRRRCKGLRQIHLTQQQQQQHQQQQRPPRQNLQKQQLLLDTQLPHQQ